MSLIWMNSLPAWENILITLIFGIIVTIGLLFAVIVFFKWSDGTVQKIEVLPSEEDLRKRRDENEKRAFNAYTKKPEGKP